ncbi:MAG: pilus assembly protein TadG-related protein [Candidatus Palauibacterales bacterium]|nr:pilus assembly protein TadG-related protein [Candidatus Palauibacterales bacterium]
MSTILALQTAEWRAGVRRRRTESRESRHMYQRISSRMQMLRRKLRDQRGAVLVVVAAGMLALTSVVALSIDVGLMTTARVEAQRAADAAALAGAGAFVGSPGNEALARELATEFAARNKVRSESVSVLEDDIVVDTDALTVQVFVYRNRERGNAIQTFFARVFGVRSVNIAASATAEAAPAGGINCLLPVAVPDRWLEAGGPGNDPDDFNPEDGDVYIPWAQPGTDPPVFNDAFTGYAQADLGQQIALKTNQANGGLNPSWYYPWRPPGQAGASDYRTNVSSCVDPSIAYYVGMEVDSEPGNMAGPTMQGFKDLIDQDPTARWNANMKCVVDDGLQGSMDPSKCRNSPRIRPVPLFDPTEEPDPGSKPFKFTNFAGIFVDEVVGKTVYGRWLGYTGFRPASPDEDTTAGPLFKVIRLID